MQGSGTNLKLVDYAAAGAPIVSTPFGVRGTRLESGAHATITSVDEFSAAIRQILDDPPSAWEMARRARAVVETDHEWRILGDRFAHAIEDALTQKT
jgi:glycosyltransferase involved in cell wall biosynthesis